MAEPLTRVPIRCSVAGCPWPDDREMHIPWCQGIPGHRCWGRSSHQHWPKKGMGGGRKSKIVAMLCLAMHDAVDNGTKYKNAVETNLQGREVYCLWEVAPYKVLIDRVIGDLGGSDFGSLEVRPAAVVSRSPARVSDHPQEAPQDVLPIVISQAETGAVPPPPLLPLCEPPTPSTAVDVAPGVSLGEGLPDIEPAPGVCWGRFGMTMPDSTPWPRYEKLVHSLRTMHEVVQLWIGDAITRGEQIWGEECYQPWSEECTDEDGNPILAISESSLVQYAWVARSVPSSVREKHPHLKYSYFREVAALPEPRQVELLALAEEGGLTTRQLHDRVKSPKAECAHSWQTVTRCERCGERKENG